jgi:hypothetical protein
MLVGDDDDDDDSDDDDDLIHFNMDSIFKYQMSNA